MNPDENETLRFALIWALTWIHHSGHEPKEGDGESYDDYSGATRLAWPDEPENWA